MAACGSTTDTHAEDQGQSSDALAVADLNARDFLLTAQMRYHHTPYYHLLYFTVYNWGGRTLQKYRTQVTAKLRIRPLSKTNWGPWFDGGRGYLVLEIGSPFRVFCDRRECPGEILQDHPHQGLKIVSERRSFPATRVVRHVKAPKMHRVTTKAKVLDGIALWSRLDDDRNAMFTGAEMLGARGV